MNLAHDESKAHKPSGLQFSLTHVFATMTAMGFFLATFLGVGRMVGMSTTEVLTQGLARSLFGMPTLLVWVVGFMLAIQHLKRNRLPATLTLIALGALILSMFVFQVTQMALIQLMMTDRLDAGPMTLSFTVIGVLHAIVNTACWILVLVAIFARRSPDVGQSSAPTRP